MKLLHTMLRVGNLQRSIDFYTKAVGMNLLRTTDRPEQKYSLAFVAFGKGNAEGAAEIELTSLPAAQAQAALLESPQGTPIAASGPQTLHLGLQMAIDFCRREKREPFLGIRMNDTHDSGYDALFPPWKRANPDCLFGTKTNRSARTLSSTLRSTRAGIASARRCGVFSGIRAKSCPRAASRRRGCRSCN